MKVTPFRKFMEMQLHRIDVDKWYEGLRIKRDPFELGYVDDWIEHNAEEFETRYDASLCKHCKKWKDCGYKVLVECSEYKKLE